MSSPSGVRISGPIERFLPGFAAELGRQGYTHNSRQLQLQLVAHLGRWLAAEGLDVGGLAPGVIERFMVSRRAAGHANHTSAKALAPLLAYLRALGVTPPEPAVVPAGAVEELISRFACYLARERALAAGTVRDYTDMVRSFLAERVNDGELDLAHLSPAEISAFVLAKSRGRSVGSAKLMVAALRSLLGFLHLEGEIARPLSGAVPSVAGWRLASLPKRLSATQVRRLLSSCDRRTAGGRRDFAILTLLVRLALRRGEVARLLLEQIDWRSAEIVILGKGARAERLPMPADVGEAIAAYLKRGRPRTALDRNVFIRVKAPHKALSPAGVSQVVVAAAGRAGLGKVHAHRLRHTAASEMLSAGASLPEVGQVLRHRTMLATAIYAKVDTQALRRLAMPWPGARS